MTYQYIKVTGKNPAELKKRIDDNLGRGYELFKQGEERKGHSTWKRGTRDYRYKYHGRDEYTKYIAVMRREKVEVPGD